MHDLHAHVATWSAGTLAAAWIATHAAGIEVAIQMLLGLVTIGAMAWAMAASRAKKRYYDQLRDDEP